MKIEVQADREREAQEPITDSEEAGHLVCTGKESDRCSSREQERAAKEAQA